MSNLFREKSLQRISSPEQLNTYVRVSTPSVWLLLSAIVVLLIGICVWGVFGHMDTVLSVAAICAAAARTQLTIAEKRGSHTLIHKQGSFPIKETDIAVLILLRGQRTGRLGGGQFAIQQCLCAFNDLCQNIIGQIHAVVGGQDAGDG